MICNLSTTMFQIIGITSGITYDDDEYDDQNENQVEPQDDRFASSTLTDGRRLIMDDIQHDSSSGSCRLCRRCECEP